MDLFDFQTQGHDEQLEHLSPLEQHYSTTITEENSICDQQEINAFAAEDTNLLCVSPPLSPYNGHEFEEGFLESIPPDDMFYPNSGGTGDDTNTTTTTTTLSGDYGGEEDNMESGNDESESVVALTDFLEVEVTSSGSNSSSSGVIIGAKSAGKTGIKRKRGRPTLERTAEEREAKRKIINKKSAQKYRAKKYVEEEAHYAEIEQLEKEQQILHQRMNQLMRDKEMLLGGCPLCSVPLINKSQPIIID